MENDETTNEFEDGLDGFLGADIEVEDQAFGSQYPVIQWVNGTPQGKASGADSIAHTGGWFMSADQGIEPPPGFDAGPNTNGVSFTGDGGCAVSPRGGAGAVWLLAAAALLWSRRRRG